QLQRQIVLAARALLAGRLALQPLLIVVEDLQWADAASLELLRDLLDHLAEQRLMVIVTHRPQAREVRPARAGVVRIELAPLDAQHTRTLVAPLLGAPAGGMLAQLEELVASRAGGIPLFVEEIVRSLIGRGLLVRDGGRWVCTDACDAVDVPPTLYGLLLSRIDALAGEGRQVLQAAAVLGVAFDAALLRRIAGEPTRTAFALRELLEADLLRIAGAAGERLCFTHALVHEVVYQNMLLARRTALHGQAARALEASLEA